MATIRDCVCIYHIALNSSKHLKFTYPTGFNPIYTGIRTGTPSRLAMGSPQNRLPSPSSSFSPHYSSLGAPGVRNPLKKSQSSPKNIKTSPSSLKKQTSVFGSIPGSGPGYKPESGSLSGSGSGYRAGYELGSGSGSFSLSGCSSFDHGVYDNDVKDTQHGLSRDDTDINPISNYDLYDKKYDSSCREEIGVFERGNRDEIGIFDSELLRDGEGMGRDRSQDKERDRERFLGSSGGIGGSAMLSQQSPLQALWTTATPRELQEDLQDLGSYVCMYVCLYAYICTYKCLWICSLVNLYLHYLYKYVGVYVVESYFNPPLMAVKKWAKRSTSHR